jgi:archaellum component FlaF (FlaF/FlaG flagellin family)
MRNRSKLFILTLSIFALLLTGVYALLSANLNITGTAGGATNFKIEFNSYTVSNESKATVNLNANKTSMTISANLSYPGDSVTIGFVIKNTGALSATVQDLVINENSNDDILVSVTGLSGIKNTDLDVGETTNGSIVITWSPTSTIQNPTSVDFNVTIDYIQTT